MIKRYIEANALLEILKRDEEYNADIPERADGIRDAIIDVLEAPTADVVERKRGRWMFSSDDAEWVCTVCQYKIYGRPYQGHYLIIPYNYCPNCGAYMKGGSD